jgi:AraC-like DNA-binding protein
LAIKISLQPGVLFCLTGIPSYELTNSYIDAEVLWGSEVRMVCEKLANAEDLRTRLNILEQFLQNLLKGRLRRNLHPVDKAGRYILSQEGAASVDWLADQSCLSRRQFIRKFEERQGINPKMFERMARFERAYLMKNRYPLADWLSIAIACGYYDYQHMVKDYKKFTNYTPPSLFELERNYPYYNFRL